MAFVAAHRVAVSPAFVGAQASESAGPMATCQPLYSASPAPETRTTSPARTPVLAPVPVVATVESAAAGERFTKREIVPLSTVTVSLLRVTVWTAFEAGLPPCGAPLPTTDGGTTIPVNTEPATNSPPMGLAVELPINKEQAGYDNTVRYIGTMSYT